MKLPIPHIKLNINEIANTVVAFSILGAGALAAFYIAQHWLGFFSYQGLNREQVIKTRTDVEKRLPILSRACGTTISGADFCRGIYLPPNGNMLYYRFEDDGRNASYNLYQVPSELWTTDKSLLPQRLIGQYQ